MAVFVKTSDPKGNYECDACMNTVEEPFHGASIATIRLHVRKRNAVVDLCDTCRDEAIQCLMAHKLTGEMT